MMACKFPLEIIWVLADAPLARKKRNLYVACRLLRFALLPSSFKRAASKLYIRFEAPILEILDEAAACRFDGRGNSFTTA